MATADGGEPWWVVIFEMTPDDFVSLTLDAPNRPEAEADGRRQLAGITEQEPRRLARVTGPFPLPLTTEDREKRPTECQGCGLVRFCGNHPPTAKQTWFIVGEDYTTEYDDIPWECVNCKTITWLPPDWQAVMP